MPPRPCRSRYRVLGIPGLPPQPKSRPARRGETIGQSSRNRPRHWQPGPQEHGDRAQSYLSPQPLASSVHAAKIGTRLSLMQVDVTITARPLSGNDGNRAILRIRRSPAYRPVSADSRHSEPPTETGWRTLTLLIVERCRLIVGRCRREMPFKRIHRSTALKKSVLRRAAGR